MKVENLIHVFDREIEVLEIKEDCMVYAIDRKDDTKNRCVIERYNVKRQKDNIAAVLGLYKTLRGFSDIWSESCIFLCS